MRVREIHSSDEPSVLEDLVLALGLWEAVAAEHLEHPSLHHALGWCGVRVSVSYQPPKNADAVTPLPSESTNQSRYRSAGKELASKTLLESHLDHGRSTDRSET